MNKTKQSRLESKGWKVGTADEFLEDIMAYDNAATDATKQGRINITPEMLASIKRRKIAAEINYKKLLKFSAKEEIKQQPYF